MSIGEEDRRRDEIIIVRRRGDNGEHGHHGGAWKIAYADFMTAMMALFLVMWLVNAASKDTRAQVASYFNPIKLSDSISSPRGLNKMQPGDRRRKEVDLKAEEQQAQPASESKSKTEGAFSNAEFFSDPHGVLAKLAAAVKRQSAKGEAFRDPFDPAFRRQSEPSSSTEQKSEPAKKSWEAKVKHSTNQSGADKTQKNELAEKLREKMQVSLGKEKSGGRPVVKVKVTKEGVVLSLTDNVEYSMFNLGAAVPNPETVVLADKLASVIKKHHEGAIIISGHTDARSFSSGQYDNWRLSTDRAHAFYHMLSRGGVDMSRVERVQGFAARRPKVPSDWNSPLNRRVEITLRTK